MALNILSVHRTHCPTHTGSKDADSAVAYAICRGASAATECNTGANADIAQDHELENSDHAFTLSRLGIFFLIDIPAGSTISSATLTLAMYKYPDPFAEATDYDWTLSIRYNASLSDPGEAGVCPVTDWPTYLGGTQLVSKYADDLELYKDDYEFDIPITKEIDEVTVPIVVPQTYLKLALMSSKDLAGTAPDDTQRTSERVRIDPDETYLRLVYTLATTDVDTDPATLVTGISATLNGTLVYDAGEDCACSFEWGLTTDYGGTTTPENKNTGETFSAGITGLLPDTTYHFRAKAVNSYGTFYGADRTFGSTGSIYPSVSTVRVSSLVHRWVPGSYTLECTLGGLTSDLGLIVPSGKPTPILPTLPSCAPDEVLSWSLERGYFCLPKAEIPPGKY